MLNIECWFSFKGFGLTNKKPRKSAAFITNQGVGCLLRRVWESVTVMTTYTVNDQGRISE